MFDEALPLNRKERYYTGTVLPMLVASDSFAHLGRFLSLCGGPWWQAGGNALDGQDRLQFFTEYSFVESVFTEADRGRFTGGLTENDTPDLVIAGDDWMVVVEAKVFHNPSAVALNDQMRRQRRIVAVMAAGLGITADRVAHVLLLPEALHAEGLDAPVVTWEAVLEAYRVVGPRYWVAVLEQALERYDQLVSRGPEFGRYRDASMTGAEIFTAYEAGTLTFGYMGRVRGLTGPELAADIADGAWRGRTYEVRVEAIGGRNWFPIQAFIELTGQIPG